MYIRRRICGLFCFSFGLGMIIGLLAQGTAVIIAAALLIVGFWMLFM